MVSQQVRLQQDIVNEIKKHEGSTFSAKFRNWKDQYNVPSSQKTCSCDRSVTADEIRKIIREELSNMVIDNRTGDIHLE